VSVWESVAEAFESAVRLPRAERARFLDERCGDDLELRREVESLLAHDAAAGDYLTPPYVSQGSSGREFEDGALVGGFRILRRLGAGGMGSVHEAEQPNPYRRVAIKLLPAFADAAAARRFTLEAELLARMNHPSIAKVYAAGVDGTVPFLAMELVEGAVAITEHVSLRDLSTVETIELFRDVCAAIAHGHARAVVHRDIKPGNVLVDASGVAKVIDFGIALALDRADGDAGRMTRTGDVVGTLQYMSPEQATGRTADVDAQSDVHALGLLMYELVCGRRAYDLGGKTLPEALRAICEDAVPPARAARPKLPAELDWILSKALEKDRARRYASVAEFDADLARWLAHEPVLAREPGALHRGRLWARRHPTATVALALFAVSLALVSTLVLSVVARGREVFRLADAETLRDLERRADGLWPARPELAAAMAAWLDEARAVTANLDEHRRTLESLRARALAPTPAEEREEADTHPRAGELAALRREIDLRRRAHERRTGVARADEPEPDIALHARTDDWRELHAIAKGLIDVDRPGRGDPRLASALLRRAAQIEGCDLATLHDTAAWALFAAGDDEGAADEGMHALASSDSRADVEGSQAALADASSRARSPEALELEGAAIERLESTAREIESLVRRRRSWRFADASDAWWHERQADLVAALEAFTDPRTGLVQGDSPAHGLGIEKRLAFARSVERRSLLEPAEAWRAVIRDLASSADDARYGAFDLTPQIGLFPLGRDPASGLEEFADLATGTVPERDAAGRLLLKPESGIVFVLIPAGSFVLGAQSTDAGGRHYDPLAAPNESPLRHLDLAAFLLAKHELTQDQWRRATGSNPSLYAEGLRVLDERIGPMHPVENVSWDTCAVLLQRQGWSFPTEAQWEYAARAGTTTPWWTGAEPASLQGAANISDRHCRSVGPAHWRYEDAIDDGRVAHAPIGSYRANAFGLHDVAGNVYEWCADLYADHAALRRAGDGLVLDGAEERRVARGGSFENNDAYFARSSNRNADPPGQSTGNTGLRPARALWR